MTGHRLQLDHLVRAPAERVWEVLTDIAHADRTLSGVTRVELLTAGPYGVGTRWRETRRMFGKEATEELSVTVAEPPSHTVIEADSDGVHYVTAFTLTPSGGGTLLAMSFYAEHVDAGLFQKALWRALGPLGAQATRKVMARDLADIAARAEQD